MAKSDITATINDFLKNFNSHKQVKNGLISTGALGEVLGIPRRTISKWAKNEGIEPYLDNIKLYALSKADCETIINNNYNRILSHHPPEG